MQPKVSIMIPFKKVDDYVRECVEWCLKLDYSNYDIVLLPDSKIKKMDGVLKDKKIKVIITGAVHPSEKRNKAIFGLKSELFASIDSDAYPKKDWLRNAVKLFKDKKVAGVGGPNLVPQNACAGEKAAVDVIYCKLGVGSAYHIKDYSYNGAVVDGVTECKEMASSNLILRGSAVKEIGGYKSELRTGEDSILGNELLAKGYKVLCSEAVEVYHHRRPLFYEHLKRVFFQGKDKGKIIKKDFSINHLVFFVPSLFVLFLVFGFLVSLLHPVLMVLYVMILLIYVVLVMFESAKSNGLKVIMLVLLGIPLTHITYGLGFIEGLVS